MENNLYLYGASGHCKVIIDILKLSGINVTAVVDDNPRVDQLFSISVVGPKKFTADDNLIISIGNNAIRKKVSLAHPANFVRAIHPSAIVSSYSEIGAGTVVMAGAVINPGTTVGMHCIINTLAVVEHDCQIHDYAHISPGVALAGDVVIGEGTHVGIGVAVIQGVRIGKWATIGAGAVILKDVPDYAVVVGNPGKILRIDHQADV